MFVNSLSFLADYVRGTIVRLIDNWRNRVGLKETMWPMWARALNEDRRMGEEGRWNCTIRHSSGQRAKNSTNVTAETLHQHQAEVNGTMSCGECTTIKRGGNVVASYRRYNIKLVKGGNCKGRKEIREMTVSYVDRPASVPTPISF